ncbi:hypothetical protein NLJ89_g10975 [Agrocybe chaxingu]|uniref:DUF4939 domain-containing protein n=1 Tax=Agrocybe chaxingu TaxID=84603 RepID=A0A9W8MRL2_9AGAR|nr:hypothetical protein NLJ89_g10975 [Agrocybe chaxingu]
MPAATVGYAGGFPAGPSTTTTSSSTREPKELRINVPPEFDGNRDDFEAFLNKCLLYLAINSGVYDTDQKRIGYVLSLMNKGEAHIWSNQFIKKCTTANGIDLGTFLGFKDILEEAFTVQPCMLEFYIKHCILAVREHTS